MMYFIIIDGDTTTIIKHHILKRHFPELPTFAHGGHPRALRLPRVERTLRSGNHRVAGQPLSHRRVIYICIYIYIYSIYIYTSYVGNYICYNT